MRTPRLAGLFLAPVIVLAALCAGAGPSWAASSSLATCLRAAGGSAVEATLCRQRELVAQDRRLNAVYNAIARRLVLGSPERKGLKAAQLAWIAERDARCGVGALVDVDCLIEETATRADELAARRR